MVQKSKEKNLPSLPKSDSEYWQGEVNVIDMKEKYNQSKCDHRFEMIGREAKCRKCGMGFFLSVDDRVEDEHLFYKDKFII